MIHKRHQEAKTGSAAGREPRTRDVVCSCKRVAHFGAGNGKGPGLHDGSGLLAAATWGPVGFELLKSMNAEKYLKKVGLGKEDYYFWKQIGKALLCTYVIFGAAWLYNETSPLGWWTLKPRPKEERELAHLYERREFPYPGDEEAMQEFIAKGGMVGTTIGPKGYIETDKDAFNYQKELQNKKFEQEAQKLWLRMRNEVIQELQEKGYDLE